MFYFSDVEPIVPELDPISDSELPPRPSYVEPKKKKKTKQPTDKQNEQSNAPKKS